MTTMTTMTTTTSRRRFVALGLLFAALCGAFTTSSASAHAAYESSSPELGEVLDEAPSEISLRFTQELFRREDANTMTLRHVESDAEVELGPPLISNDDRHVMRAPIRGEVAFGRYLVSWTNLSAEDGDADRGSYSFYVGRDPSPAEIAEDRELAASLLVVYPGDQEQGQESIESNNQASPTVVTVARSDDGTQASIGVGPIVWLAVGAVALVVIIGALGYELGTRRRAA